MKGEKIIKGENIDVSEKKKKAAKQKTLLRRDKRLTRPPIETRGLMDAEL